MIQWKSKVNGRAGQGTKMFEREEAKRLAEELNREYPQIEHEAVRFGGRSEMEAAGVGSAELAEVR